MAKYLCGKLSALFWALVLFIFCCLLVKALLLALVVLSLQAYGLSENLQDDLFSSLYALKAFLSLYMSLTSCLFLEFMKVKDLAIAFLTTLIFDSFEATPDETLLTLKVDNSFCNSSTVVLRSATFFSLKTCGF